MRKRGIEWVWENGLPFMYNGEYVKSLDALFKKNGIRRVLDVSCGVGFPSIGLSKLGYNMTCADASPEMIKTFRRNCVKEGVKLEPVKMRWQDLTSHFGEEFDCVLCRGNSLPYAISWETDVDLGKAPAEIEASLMNFHGVLKRGGMLYVDVHRRESLTPKRTSIIEDFGERIVNGSRMRMVWKIEHNLLISKRSWEPCIRTVNGNLTEETKVKIDGYHLKHEELKRFIENAGFKKTEIYKEIGGEDNYDVFLAFK